jgi:hypothetical protein
VGILTISGGYKRLAALILYGTMGAGFAIAQTPVSADAQSFLNLVTTYRGKAFCAPPGVTLGDAAKVVSQYVEAHPELQGRYTDQQALQALAAAYPCTVSSGSPTADTPLNQMVGRKLQVTPGGEYATIDTKPDISLIQRLRSGSGSENADLAAQVVQAPGNYTPPVLFSLAEWYYKQGQIDDAIFWLNAAGLRGRFDAAICTDVTARSAIAEISQKLPPDLFRQQFQDPARIKRIVDKVIDWDARTPAGYDHRWISLHGLKATNSGLGIGGAPGALTLPQDQWRGIAEQNRQKYRADMYKYMDAKPIQK